MDVELRAFEICSPILEKVFLSCNFSFFVSLIRRGMPGHT